MSAELRVDSAPPGMTRAWSILLCLLLTLSGVLPTLQCGEPEPYAGCLLAAANQREVLRARSYLHPAIPARILLIRSADGTAGHAALVYHLDPEGWVLYDDTFGSRPLHLRAGPPPVFPDALTVARAAFPSWPIGRAWYMAAAAR